MKMTKKSFLTIAMVFLGLHTGVGTVLGQGIGGLIGGIDPENPATWFYVNLTAQPSTPACGTDPGQVWLRSVAPTGNEENPYADSNPYVLPEKPVDPYNGEMNWQDGFDTGANDAESGKPRKSPDYMYENNVGGEEQTERIQGYYAGYDWYKSGHYLNETNPVGFAATVSLKGYTVVYAPGFEDMNVFGNVFSAYASFYGKTQENDGWYFAGWSFTEGDTDLGVGDENGVLFRVLPAATAGEANMRNEYVYATFKPVMVSDYKVNGLINGTGNSTTVVFDAIGERVTAEDFKEVTCSDANFSASITSCKDNKVTVTVTYSGDANGEFRGNVTLESKSGCSQLTAPVYARVGVDAANEATLYDGKTPTATSGTLEAMIAAANGTNKIVVLNKNYESNLSVNANVTLNFNGYTIQKHLTIEGGEVTIAYDKYGSNGKAVSVTGGKLILNGGEFSSLQISNGATVEQNGATITGTTTNNGSLVTTEGRFEGGLTSAGTLTVNGGAFEGETAITVNGGTAIFNKAAISGTTTGILVEGGETTISSKLVSVYGRTNAVKRQTAGSIVLQNGKFDGATPLVGTINLQGGYFKTNTPGIDIDGKKVLNVLAGTEYAEGYRYFIGNDVTGIGVCRIGTTSYATLEAALAYANNNPTQDVVIIMTNDYTLPAGYYTLPAKATLIVPMSDEQETGYEIVNRVSNNSVSHTDYVQPYEFRRLTFAYGVNIDVHGTIELTCTQRASDDGYAAMPHGPYGHLVMEEGSHMTLQSGSLLRAWGFMTGKGETDARRGSKVREQFQMGDWKGGSISFSMLADDRHVFPITQYFIQNVESPVKYHPGAILSTTTSVSANFGSMGITAMANDIVIVGVSGGDPAMFFMDQEADAENTWVRKWYDAEHDIQTYDVNSGAHIGSMVLDLGKLGTQPLVMNSATFVLPITNNMKIHLLSGQMDFTQTTALLPGAEVEVDKESTVTIYADEDDLSTLSSFESNYNSWVANGQEGDAPEKPILSTGELFVYDADEWGNYAKGKGDVGTKYTKVVKYSPSWDGALVSGKPADGKPNVRSESTMPGDATINVHGTFNTGYGAVYTTAGGANIFSSNEDAGSFIVNRPTPTYTAKIYQVANASASSYKFTEAVSAKLKNGAGAAEAYTATAGTGTNLAFLYRDNTWQTPIKDNVQTFYFDCYTAEVDMAAYAEDVQDKFNNIAIYHAPDNIAECMAIMSGMSVNAVNANTLRNNPQVMAAVTPQIEAMREAGYDLGGAVQHIYIKPQEWLEIAAQAHIKLNFDQDYLDDLETSYNAGNYADAVQNYMDYVQTQAYNPYLEGVEGNADHTYSDADGAGRLFIKMDNCQWWEVEKKDNLYHCIHPNNDTYYYWDDDENSDTYESWQEQKFSITWKNWDGSIVQTVNKDGELQDSYKVPYGTVAEFLGTNPTREATNDYTYDFTGWSPALDSVKSDVTYTATYTQKPRTYTIIFLNEGGVEIERQFLTLNEWPVCENTPTKIGHTLEWTPAIAAVTRDTTYTAKWLEEAPEKYEITFFDYDGKKILKQGDVNVGETPIEPATPAGKPETSEFTYVFDHWSPAIEAVSIEGPKSYTAVYREVAKKYTIYYYKEDGSTPNPTKSSETLEIGATPIPPTVTKEDPVTGHKYNLVWKTLDGTGTIQTVQGNASYKPTYTDELEKYTVTLKANPSGACTFAGAGTFDYGTTVNNVTVSYDEEQYEFQGWSDLTGDAKMATTHAAFTLTEDITIVADFRYKGNDKVTITWKNWNGGDLGTSEPKVNAATTFIGATPTREASESKTYTFYGWYTKNNEGDTLNIYKNGMTPKAADDATYYAYFNEEVRKYTISWKNENGADIEVDYNQPHGAVIEYNSATPTKSPDALYSYTFDGWTDSKGGDVVSLPAKVTGNAAFYAHFNAVSVVPVVEETLIEAGGEGKDEVTISDPVEADHLIVHMDGKVTVTASATVDEFIIESNGTLSGEVIGAANITAANAYFDLNINAQAKTWYAVAVPWKVSVEDGIFVNGVKQFVNSNFYLLTYDGNDRAQNGPSSDNWVFEDNTCIMEPGTLYMIYMVNGADVIRFKKKDGQILTTSLNVYAHSSANVIDAGWNGIANPALYHAFLNAGATDNYTAPARPNFGQKYIPGDDSYDPIDMKNNKLIVGQPVFVQVEDPKTVVAEANNTGFAAPRRRVPRVDNAYYEVHISAGESYTDRLYLQTLEDKEDRYVIGLDLAKAGVSTKVAQMWVNRYNAKLCVNTTAPVGKTATYPLGISVPENGTYQISSATEMQNNQELYVTRNGSAIWNLAYGPYTVTLDKGTYSEYGIKLIQSNAPAVTTGVDQTQTTNDKQQIQKVIIDNQVYIVREGALYTITGQKVQ